MSADKVVYVVYYCKSSGSLRGAESRARTQERKRRGWMTSARRPVVTLFVRSPPPFPKNKPNKQNKQQQKATYGHVATLAKSIADGVNACDGVTCKIFRVAETLPKEVLAKMHALSFSAEEEATLPPVIDPKDLANADGIIFGSPTRFGGFCAQMRALFDATGGLWQSGALAGKPAGLFCSVGTQGGGIEATLLTAIPYLAHQGMMFVPAGYGAGPALFGVEELRGGSPWGASTYAGADGSRKPSALELEIAKKQGESFAAVVKRLG